MDQPTDDSVKGLFHRVGSPDKKDYKTALRAVEIVFANGAELMAAVRAGRPPFDAVRSRLAGVKVRGITLLRVLLDWAIRAIDDWAERRGLGLVRGAPLHWPPIQFDDGLRLYVERTEAILSRQVDEGHSVILATTEEPRRFARYLLRQFVDKRPVYLWTVASGLFRVSGSGSELAFTRPGDIDDCRCECRAYRLSELTEENGSTAPEKVRLALEKQQGYERIGVGIDERKFRVFVDQDHLGWGIRLDIVVDDLEEGEDPPTDLEYESIVALVRLRKLEAFCEPLSWPPKGPLGMAKETPPFLGEIQYVMSIKRPDALFILLDGNIFLESQGGLEAPKIAPAFLKDAGARLRRARTRTQIVVLSAPLAMTRALTDELVCIDLPLPSRDEITVALRREFDKHRLFPGNSAGTKIRISDEMSMLSDAAAGMTLQDVATAIRGVSHESDATIAKVHEALQRGKQAAVKRSPALELVQQFPPDEMSLGGMRQMLVWLEVRRRVFERPELARRFGIERRPKGILLLGVPGTGKSLAAKIIAREWKLPLVRLDMGAVHNAFVGASEQRIREALRIVEAMSPCVFWIDEIDKGIAQGEGTMSHSVDLNIRATLLTWLQESSAAVFCVATANRFSNLPPELTRAGRFDARFFLGCPNAEGRREILDIHLAVRGITVEDEIKKEVVEKMHGFTGAEIEQAVLDGLYTAFAADRELAPQDILDASARIKPIVRAIGKGLDEVWALVDEGRVELASDQFLTRSDLAKLIDPTLFSPMYCRREGIGGWDKHHDRAQRMLMADPQAPRAAALLSTGDPNWIYVETNVPYSEVDAHPFKFLDEVSVITHNGVLDTLVAELGVEIFYVENQALSNSLAERPGFSGYAEIFKPQPERGE